MNMRDPSLKERIPQARKEFFRYKYERFFFINGREKKRKEEEKKKLEKKSETYMEFSLDPLFQCYFACPLLVA